MLNPLYITASLLFVEMFLEPSTNLLTNNTQGGCDKIASNNCDDQGCDDVSSICPELLSCSSLVTLHLLTSIIKQTLQNIRWHNKQIPINTE